MHYFHLFFKENLKTQSKIFARLDENHKLLKISEKFLTIFDENSIEILIFYLFLVKVVAKNIAFGNNIIFLQQFFRFGGLNPPTPCVRH